MRELHWGFMHSSSLNSSPETKYDLSPTLLPSSYLSVCAVTICCGLPRRASVLPWAESRGDRNVRLIKHSKCGYPWPVQNMHADTAVFMLAQGQQAAK